MHSLNGNTSKPNKLARELKNLTNELDGNKFTDDFSGIAGRRSQRSTTAARTASVASVEAVVPDLAPRKKKQMEEDEEWLGAPDQREAEQQEATPQTRSKKKQRKKREPIAKEESTDTAWAPNSQQSITIEISNRRNEKLKDVHVNPMEADAIENRKAIIVATECRINPEDTKHLEMKHFHGFFTGISKDEREQRYLSKHCKDIDEMILNAPNVEEQEKLQLQKNQALEKLKHAPTMGWKHGLVMYVNKGVFPSAVILHKSQDHLLVEVTDMKGKDQLLLAVYGPPEGAEANNAFFETTITDIHRKYQHRPILQMGDHNALVDERKDCKIKQSDTPSKKVALHNLVTEFNLTDLRRKFGNTEKFTFSRINKGQIAYEANVDFFIANQQWLDRFANNIHEVETKRIPDKDHLNVLLELRQFSKKVQHTRPTTYKRELDEKQQDLLIKTLEQANAPNAKATEQIEAITNALQKFQTENLMYKASSDTETSRKPHNAAEHEYKKRQSAVKATDKLIRFAVKAPNQIDLNAIWDNTQHEKNDQSYMAKIRKQIRKLHKRGFDVPRENKSKQAWVERLVQFKKTMKNAARASLRKMKRIRIQEHVQRLVESFADQPRHFFRKMRAIFNKQAVGLTEVRIYENGRTRVSADPSEVKERAADFYQELYNSRGERNNHYEKWLTPRNGTRESHQQLQADFTTREVEETIKGLRNLKATGEDSVPAEILKIALKSDNFTNILTKAFQAFKDHTDPIPDKWKEGIMTLLFKNGDVRSRKLQTNHTHKRVVQGIHNPSHEAPHTVCGTKRSPTRKSKRISPGAEYNTKTVGG